MKKWTEFRLWVTLGYVIELNEVKLNGNTSIDFAYGYIKGHFIESLNLMKCFNDVDFDEKLNFNVMAIHFQ